MPRERSIVASVKAASFLAWLNLALALLGSICVFSAGALPGWVTMCSDTGCPVSFNIWGLDDILTRSQRDTALAFVVFAFVTSALSALFLLSYVILPGYRGCPQVVVWSLLFTGFTVLMLLGACVTVGLSLKTLADATFTYRFSSSFALAAIAMFVYTVLFFTSLLEILYAASMPA